MNYNGSELENLLADESFQNWILGKSVAEEREKWEHWLNENSSRRRLVEDASQVLKSFAEKKEIVSPQVISGQWEELKRSLEKDTRSGQNSWRQMLKYAAAVALLIATSFGIYNQLFKSSNSTQFVVYHSNFGEKQEVVLPDGSRVILNANSTLKTQEKWNTGSREVWLESGEAYFKVTKQKDKSNFLVHTEDLHVEVLGTQFNVNLTTGVSVMLDEGSIKLLSGEGESLMSPGEVAEYVKGGKLIISRAEDSERYTAWLNNKVAFDNTSLLEIANYVKRHYGVHIQIRDSLLQKRQLSGEIPNDNLDLLLNAISAAMDLSIKRENGRILIEDNH